jgi:type IV pilus assembly protein PilC
MLEAVETAVIVLNNRYVTSLFTQVQEDIRRGEMLSQALDKTGLFDSLFSSMVYVGEESGNLDSSLTKIAEYYDNDAQSAITRMVTLLEPAMLIFIGVIIALVMAGVFLPVYSMYSNIL